MKTESSEVKKMLDILNQDYDEELDIKFSELLERIRKQKGLSKKQVQRLAESPDKKQGKYPKRRSVMKYRILVETVVEMEDKGTKEIPWFTFKGWEVKREGDGFKKRKKLFETDQIHKETKENMKTLGESIFEAARRMYDND